MRHLGDGDVTARSLALPYAWLCWVAEARLNVRPAFLLAGRPADCCLGMPNAPQNGRYMEQPCLPPSIKQVFRRPRLVGFLYFGSEIPAAYDSAPARLTCEERPKR